MTTGVDFALGANASLSGAISTGGAIPTGALIELLDGSTLVAQAGDDDAGYYTLTDLAPGTYTLVVDQWQYALASMPVTITAGQAAIQNVTLAPTSYIDGTITQTIGGDPIASASLLLVSEADEKVQTMITGTDGHFGFSRLDPGSYILMLPDGSHRQEITIAAADSHLTVALQ